ncbi:hypothetical protein P22_1560 [Propionispora sp. 2/2-37]|uniref:ATP synthase subunit I n=1 Tax=Propionispora sp. 2/2-37 TaxID=1677858 RepID=UPI0006BB576E|nr:ATP synthase subunit I [Propionispora sp. 2/2-37]CUH95489.1 hypothetical protein P22_1560 [Propionispora sp. 2/2-37]
MQSLVLEGKRILNQVCLWSFLISFGSYLMEEIEFAYGILTGSVSGVAYLMMMSFRVKKAADLPLQQAIAYMRTGWIIRLGFIALVASWAVNMPNVDIVGMLFGLFLLYIIVFFHVVKIVMRTKDNRKLFIRKE